MEGKKVKWGNIFILVLIIAAGIAAFYYKDPVKFQGLFGFGQAKVEKAAKVQEGASPSGKAVPATGKAVPATGKAAPASADKTTPAPVNKTTPTADQFIMGLDSWIGGTPVLIALNREYNKDYFLSMEVKYITNDRDRITALKDGVINVTEMTLPAFLRFQQEFPGSGAIIGITDFSRGADGIIAKAGINTLNDMEGKAVSFVSDGIGKFILNKFLRLTGLRYQDIKPIEHKEMGEVVGDLKSGKADLIVSWSPDMNLALKEINAAKPDSAKMLINTREVPDLVPTVLVANRNTVEKYPKKVEAFLKTWYASAKYILEKPDKAYDKLAELMSGNKDVYGNVSSADIKDSFANIKLMSLNDNFTYFGLDGKDKKIDSIISDTIKTWQKFGDMPEGYTPGNIVSDSYIGSLFKENDKELLVGALDSSITGNAAQTTDEKKEFKKQDETSIEKNTQKIAKVDIPPVYYDSGKAAVKAESAAVLNEVESVLRQFPEFYLIIDAHTDTVGSEESNLKLSKDRAQTVMNYLVSKGVDGNRIVARGWGEYRLIIAQENTEEDRAKNRRTEFILTRDAAAK